MPLPSALTTTEQNTLAAGTRAYARLYYIPTLTETARIDAPTALTYPRASFPIKSLSSGFLTNVKPGMTVFIGSTAGSANRGRYRVRKAPTSNTLFVDHLGAADSGLSVEPNRTTGVSNDDHVTVFIGWQDLWALPTRIEMTGPTDGIFYKNFDLTYDGQTSHKAPPIVNLGPHLAVSADPGQTYATLSLTADVRRWVSTISTYSWETFPAWSATSGATTANFSGRAPQGFSVVRCTVTLASGASFTATRGVWVDGPTLDHYVNCVIESDQSGRDGWRMTARLLDADLNLVRAGSFVHMRIYQSPDVSSAMKQFSGWVVTENWETGRGTREATIEVLGPGQILRRLVNRAQRLEAANPATNWTQASAGLCKVRFFIDYLLRWHAANQLELFDFFPDTLTSTSDQLPALECGQGSVWDQCNQMANRAFIEMTCDSTGALYLLRHPSRRTTAERSSVVTRATLDASRYFALSIDRPVRGDLASLDGWGNKTNSVDTAYHSRAPGSPIGQGSSSLEIRNFIVTSQSQLNTWTGLEYAKERNAWNANIRVAPNWLVFDPAHLQYVFLQNPAALNPRNGNLNANFIPLQVTRNHRPEEGVIEVTMTAERETNGLPGETIPIPNQILDDEEWPEDVWEEDYELIVEFATGDPPYTILNGTILLVGPSPSVECLQGTSDGSGFMRARIRVDLPNNAYVKEITTWFDLNEVNPPFFGGTIPGNLRATLLGDNDVEIGRYERLNQPSLGMGYTWNFGALPFDPVFPGAAGVKSVIFEAWCTNTGLDTVYLDRCRIVYTLEVVYD